MNHLANAAATAEFFNKIAPLADIVAPDPILAGIAKTRAALDQALALEAASTGNLPTAWGEACETAVDALHEHVLAVAPTTLDGCRAAAQLMLDLRPGLGLELEDEVTLLLKRIAGEPAAAAEAPAAKPEASLLDQIIAHWRVWAAASGPDETDAEREAYEHISARRDALLEAAEALPPTLENVTAKALAAVWLEYVSAWRRGLERDEYDFSERLFVDVDTGIVGRFGRDA